jgi:DNA polymerase III sliding clamp (beta) subunit (PCNA family)
MQRIEGDAVLMLGDSMAPALLHDTADSEWLAVVVPMRV